MNDENHITKLPLGMQIAKSLKRESKFDKYGFYVNPRKTEEQCVFYRHEKDNIEKHCLSMNCDGYRNYFCWTAKKEKI